MSTHTALPEQTAIDPAMTALGFSKRVQLLDEAIKQFSELASVGQYQLVAEYGLKAAAIIKEAENFYKDEIANLYATWKAKTSERAAILDPASRIKDISARLCGSWQRRQEEIRLAEERRQQEEERQRAETAVLEEAAALEKDGRGEEAQALIESPVCVAPVSVPTAVPKVNGMSRPKITYKAEVTSLMMLVKAVASGAVPLTMIQANEQALNRMAFTLREELKYPGVRVVSSAKASFRG